MNTQKLIKWTLLAAVVGSGLGLQVQAQSLSLKQAVAQALAHSHQSTLYRSRVDGAEKTWKATQSQLIPSLRLSGQDYYLSDARVSGLSTGSAASGGPQVSQLLLGQANLTAPLFAGLSTRRHIETARLRYEAAGQLAAFEQEMLGLEVVDYFAALYQFESLTRVAQEQWRSAREREADFESREQQGLATHNEVLKAKVQAAQWGLRVEEYEKNSQLAQKALQLLLQLPANSPIRIDIETTRQEQLMAQAPGKSPQRADLEAYNKQIEVAQKGVQLAQSPLFPTVSLVGGYIAFNLKNVLEVSNAMNIGLSINYDVSQWFKAPKQVQAAKAQVQIAQHERDVQQERIEQGLHEAHAEYDFALKRKAWAQQHLEQTRENAAVLKSQYDNGLATATQWLEAEALLAEAQVQQQLALAEEARRFYHWHFAAGTLLNALQLKP